MENYQDMTKVSEWQRPSSTEDDFTKSIEEYTAAIPSSAYLGVAIAAMGISFLCQVTGQGKWGNFIAQWVPTWLIIGLYNKVVKVEGHDQTGSILSNLRLRCFLRSAKFLGGKISNS